LFWLTAILSFVHTCNYTELDGHSSFFLTWFTFRSPCDLLQRWCS